MGEKDSVQDVIKKYRKKQQRSQTTPKIIFIIAAILLIIGAIVLVFWFTGAQPPAINFLNTDTPTPTSTYTSSPVPPTDTPSATPTAVPPTNTSEPSPTPTISWPVIYTAEEGDNFFSIADKFGIDIIVLIEVNRDRMNLDPNNPVIRVGDEILIPSPDTQLPTPTPLPTGLPAGYRIEYMVQVGDTLETIAQKFLSTVDDILKQNKDLEDPNAIYPGQILTIRINLVTAVPTEQNTKQPASTPGTIATLTPTP
ncbi:MAG TPA: LysM peptidoglycan-binding domain-containing protein [Anaerolineae bacterium]|nr:LysM peptidoglycan-binding domain-containing protein [Anaerolineae bacterium]